MNIKSFTPLFVACAFGILCFQAGAQTADYPQRAVRIVVPFAAGGSTDVVARVLADKLGQEMKQPFVIDNRAGAGGNIGADIVAKAPADGYTLLMATTGILAINEYLYKNLSYKSRDFTPVSYTSLISNILVVSPSVPANDVMQLITLAKKNPGTLSFASSGAGSSTHLSGELFKSMTGTEILHVPYRGSAMAITDVVAGQVTMLFDNAPASIAFVKEGKLKALAVTSKKRLPNLPNVPTLEEAGVPGYESLSWSGLVAPPGTPAAVVLKLNQAIDRILKTDEIRQRFAALGVDPVGGPPESFTQQIRTESDKWGKLIKSANIVME